MKKISSFLFSAILICIPHLSIAAVDCDTDCNARHRHRPDLKAFCNAKKVLLNCDNESADCRISRLADPGNYDLTKMGYTKAREKRIIKNASDCDKLADNHAFFAKEVCSMIKNGPWCYAGSALTKKQGHCVCKLLEFPPITHPSPPTLPPLPSVCPPGQDYERCQECTPKNQICR